MELPPVNRRQALAGFGTVSLSALLAACGGDDNAGGAAATTEARAKPKSDLADLFDETSSCKLSPELTEGPFYFDVDSFRSDIREDRDGVTLRLALRVRDAESCEPIRNAVVDIWQCDAEGRYSGIDDDETFLRGAQVTNSSGIVEFLTVYPGWYQGRTVHIHAKIHLNKQTVLTTQLFFDEKTQRAVYDSGPYAVGDTDNDNDSIFNDALVLATRPEGDGYLGAISVDVGRA